MAKLQFPQNIEALDSRKSGFGPIWLRWLNAVQRRLGGFDAVDTVSTTDIAAAGGAYNQAYIQTIADMVNELKAKQNETITTLKN